MEINLNQPTLSWWIYRCSRIGDWNCDPGSGLVSSRSFNATKDHTLVRKCSVSQGNELDGISGSTTENLNGKYYPTTWSDLGQHYQPVKLSFKAVQTLIL